MQKQAMALGYFFLAIFCVFTSSQGYLQRFSVALLLAALAAALMGLGYLVTACANHITAVKNWLLQMGALAQQPPVENRRRTAEGPSTY